ncbi:MAG: CDP-alcohol phosphatidyltransferase family protein [Nitrososphaerota archaeon]|nr:CDP-alcohol phosphatidyltransferase family protein [Nitrososphaerota archaeon]MDG6979377.1 CDP-alcohol phosphatidyltransferase family protein [Nitrososphaerota archaeon]
MLDNLRTSLAAVFAYIGRGASKAIPNPTAWTALGLLLAALAAALFARGAPLEAGLALAGSGFLDIVDGAVARATGRTSQTGAFLDSTLDRVSEVLIYLGILVGGLASPPLVLVALSLSLLVSYARAKGDALGVSLAGVGIGERSERLVVLIVAALAGAAWLGVAVVLVLALVTFVQRAVRVTGALAKREAPA